MKTNTQILIDSIPQGALRKENYRIAEASIPSLKSNEVLLKTVAIAITAGTRAGLQGSASYAGTPQTGIPMNATGIGRVEASESEEFRINELVVAPTGWQLYSKHATNVVNKIDPLHNPIDYLGPLGINGLTAYFGLLEVAKLISHDIVMISAAGGSVGHIAGQIAKLKGSRVIGICGDTKKSEKLVSTLNFDAALNYKKDNYRQTLKEATPEGVDVYFDNTGGIILGSALRRLNIGGRIACCGVVSQYDTNQPEPGPTGIPGLLVNKRITMRGFLVFDYTEHYAKARQDIAGWLAQGKLQHLTDEVSGLEKAPEAFVDLLAGGNIGTRIIKIN